MKFSKPMLRALRFVALPFHERPRRVSFHAATFHALHKRGLIKGPPWQITDAGRKMLDHVDQALTVLRDC